jgi:undecaprenyl-phosphate galactose phosphotransferase/putative colanic acid biosynthesis UDP-glucose lipid carrier transferase
MIGGAAYQMALNGTVGDLECLAGFGLIGSLAYALAAHRCDLYQPQGLLQSRRDYMLYLRVCACWLWAVLVVSVVLFLMKVGADVSRGSIVCAVALGSVALPSWRAAVRQWLRGATDRNAIRGRRAVVLGSAEELAGIRASELMMRYGLEEVGRVPMPRQDCAEVRQLQAAAVSTALAHARNHSAEEIILALPWGNVADLESVRDQLRFTPLPVRLLPDRSIQRILNYRSWSCRQSPLIEMARPPLSASERVAKRTLDVLFAASALVALLPLMLLVAAAIRLGSPGPAIFRQRRKGFNGKEYVIYKFRTMTVMEDGPAIVQARKSDARVTWIGRLLRQTSIDELPQLYNVLRGEMSMVGPRPHALAHDDEYSEVIANYAFRHHVKPGITGWAQVHGFRGATPQLEQMAKRIELDLWYISNWTLALDLRILLRTSVELVRGRNAY